ncbi:MAG: hypothetical protein GY821_14020 [Gammaproteobacteria bacterium]|nr:hypothetical protein [Gammaproteobacteria bacterium]
MSRSFIKKCGLAAIMAGLVSFCSIAMADSYTLNLENAVYSSSYNPIGTVTVHYTGSDSTSGTISTPGAYFSNWASKSISASTITITSVTATAKDDGSKYPDAVVGTGGDSCRGTSTVDLTKGQHIKVNHPDGATLNYWAC